MSEDFFAQKKKSEADDMQRERGMNVRGAGKCASE